MILFELYTVYFYFFIYLFIFFIFFIYYFFLLSSLMNIDYSERINLISRSKNSASNLGLSSTLENFKFNVPSKNQPFRNILPDCYFNIYHIVFIPMSAPCLYQHTLHWVIITYVPYFL